YGAKRREEEVFQKWASSKPEYASIFSDLKTTYDAWRPYALHRQYINEGIIGSPLLAFAASLQGVETALTRPGVSSADIKKATDAAATARKNFLASHNRVSDQNIVAAVLQMFYQDVPKDQHPLGFFEAVRNEYGGLDKATTYQKYAEAVFRETALLDDAKWNEFMRNSSAATLQQDLAFSLASTFVKNYTGKYAPMFQQFTTRNNEWARLYLKGVQEQNPKKIMYPDATFTMRVSYGKVDDYTPRDAVRYDYVTTSKGLLEKYKPGDYEFDLPKKAVDMLKAKDFGQYKDVKYNELVTGFITSNDITGGNSGSPVLNGAGELIGLAFDGNYEALSHKLAFDKDLNRTINVDIRYVLWCIDKLGGAANIVKELTLRK
ncbi:MAG TPA: S46 family peptidase, partial [Flavisolibacter sp.]|nr:S46 family peptidase [Flavisolibacter sp.]